MAKIRLARLRRGCTVLRTMKAQSMVNIDASCHQVVAMVGADCGVSERLEARSSCARAAIITGFSCSDRCGACFTVCGCFQCLSGDQLLPVGSALRPERLKSRQNKQIGVFPPKFSPLRGGEKNSAFTVSFSGDLVFDLSCNSDPKSKRLGGLFRPRRDQWSQWRLEGP